MFYDYAYEMPEKTYSSENGAIEKVTASFNLPKDYDWRGELPAVGDYIEPYGYYTGYTVSYDAAYAIVRMSFSASPATESPSRENRKDKDIVWSFHLYTYEKDLRLHPDYKTWWNYNLAVSQEVNDADIAILNSTGMIGGYNVKTATDITITDADLIQKIRWVADTSEIPAGWAVAVTRQYTFDAYKDFSGNATKIEYFKTYQAASDAAAMAPAKLQAPTMKIPLTTQENGDWMIDDISCGGDGDLYTLTTIYQFYSEGWTPEIYT